MTEFKDANGLPHNIHGPAISKNGVEEYWWHGILHNPHGAAISSVHGERFFLLGREYTKNGWLASVKDNVYHTFEDRLEVKNFANQNHCLDGPAYITALGSVYYFVNGKKHRLDGPAVKNADGTEEFWVNGNRKDLPEPVKLPPLREVIEEVVSNPPTLNKEDESVNASIDAFLKVVEESNIEDTVGSSVEETSEIDFVFVDKNEVLINTTNFTTLGERLHNNRVIEPTYFEKLFDTVMTTFVDQVDNKKQYLEYTFPSVVSLNDFTTNEQRDIEGYKNFIQGFLDEDIVIHSKENTLYGIYKGDKITDYISI